MGFFKSFFGGDKSNYKPQPNNQPNKVQETNTPVVNSLNLSKESALKQLNTRKNMVESLCLTKDNLKDLTARVAVVLDYSGSMESEYKRGNMQTLLDRLLPLAMKFDDNGELDLWLFHNEAIRLDGIREDNFYDYINRSGILRQYRMYGTEYAPVMEDVVEKYIREEPSQYPNLVIFITDGENSDRSKAEKFMKQFSKHPIFWQFVGIGNSSFPFLEELDEMEGRLVDNANFFPVNDLMYIDDDTLYNRLLSEYPDWINKINAGEVKNKMVYKKQVR